jgi:hypothetical protein
VWWEVFDADVRRAVLTSLLSAMIEAKQVFIGIAESAVSLIDAGRLANASSNG